MGEGPDDDHRIVSVICALRPGEVVSYGDVADEAGLPGRARRVGRLLAIAPVAMPWWRVVAADGRLVPGHEPDHAARLRAEGAVVIVTAAGWRVRSSPRGRFAARPVISRRP